MAAPEKDPDLRLLQKNPLGKDSPFSKALLLLDPVSVFLRRHMALRRFSARSFLFQKVLFSTLACFFSNHFIRNLSLKLMNQGEFFRVNAKIPL